MRTIRFAVISIFTFLALSCYDFESLENGLNNTNDRIDNLENRVGALEELCGQFNTNITSLQIIVAALQQNDYITSVLPLEKDGEVIGYSLLFSKSGAVTIYHGHDGKNGQNGKDGQNGEDGKDGVNGTDGYVPQIGVKADADGIYYWTLDGEWLLDESGNKIKAEGTKGDAGDKGDKGDKGYDGEDGVTPELKIEEGYWYISYNGGDTWDKLGKAVGEDGQDGLSGDSFFQRIDTSNQDYVLLILSDGTEIKVPSMHAFEALSAMVNQMNINISAVQVIVDALQSKDYVESVEPILENGETVGYNIKFAKSGTVTIYHGKNGVNGENGTDGYVPQIGVRKHTDGCYYWTIDGTWLLDEFDNMVKAEGEKGDKGDTGDTGDKGDPGDNGDKGDTGDKGEQGEPGKDGVTPKLKIENSYWYVSYDDGESWSQLGKATGDAGVPGQDGKPGEPGECIFESVVPEDDYVYFNLANGEVIAIPLSSSAVVNRLQSIRYIPMSDDGKAAVSFYNNVNSTVELNFFITPKDLVTEFAENYETNLSLNAVNTMTGTIDLVEMPILSCSADAEKGVLSLTASGINLSESFFAHEQGANAFLSISYGSIDAVSEYIPIVAVEQVVPKNEIWYESSDQSVISFTEGEWGGYYYDSSTFYGSSNKIISNTYENGVGKVVFQTSVLNVPKYAFDSMKNLTRITLPNSVVRIEVGAFEDCSGLTEFTTPNDLKYIGGYPFINCPNITRFKGKHATEDGYGFIVDGVFAAWSRKSPVENLVIPDGVTVIGAYAFEYCANLRTVELPESVTEINQSAFMVCTLLEKINIPSKVTKLSDTFYKCENLKEITLPENLRDIGFTTFAYCKRLTYIKIPTTVTSIGSQAFSQCTALKNIFLESQTPPSGGSSMFPKNTGMKIYVPVGYTYDYKNKDSYWKDYEKYLVGYDYQNGLADVDYNQCSDFYSNTYISYVGNEHIVNTSSGDYYRYKSNFPIHTTDDHTAISLSFKLNVASGDSEICYLTSNNDEYGLFLTSAGLGYGSDTDKILYTWAEMGLTGMGDQINLFWDINKKVFKVNYNVCEYKFRNTLSEIEIKYWYGGYCHDRDDGEDYDVYRGLPEGSQLYYAKAWDADGLMTYIGYKSSAKNPDTGVEENCWRWHTKTSSGYDFAYNSGSGRQPYGAGSGF